MKYIMTWVLCCALVFVSKSQTISVKDQVSNEPIPTVVAHDPSTGRVLYANGKGQLDISSFADLEIIQISSYGYQTVRLNFQELTSLPDATLYLEKSNINLGEVVVAANKWRQNSDDVPQKIVTIAPSEIRFQDPQTAADLLGISGKVYVQKSQQGGGSPMIRGFATNRLLYSVDGVRMNNAIFRGGNLQNVINLDPFVISDAEVLFGPASVIYGSDAIGGVMSFETIKPGFSLDDETLIEGTIVSRFSSANKEKTGHADLQIGWKKWALATSFSSWDYDDLRQGSHGPEDYIKRNYVERINGEDVVLTLEDPALIQIPSGYSQKNFMQKIRFQPSNDWEFNYGFHYSATSSYGRYDRHNRVRNGLPRYAEWDYGPQKWMMNHLKVTHNQAGVLYDRVNLSLALQNFEESRIDRSLNDPIRNTQIEKVTAYSANLDFSKSINSKKFLFYGLEWVKNKVNSAGFTTDIETGEEEEGPTRYPKSDWNSFGAYVNLESKIHEKATLQSGLRYSWYGIESQFDTRFYPFPFEEANLGNGNLTGSVGIVYRPEESWVLSSNLGTAFRSPNVDDIGKVFDSEPGAVTVPNPDLKPEYATNIDLSLAKLWGDAFKVDITGFYTHLANALVRRNFQLNGQDSILYDGELSQVQAIQNAAEARVYGIQIGVKAKLTKNLSIFADINFQEGKEELDDGSTSPSRHAAPLFGVTRLDYQASRLRAQLYLNFQGERSFENLAQEERAKDEIYAKDENGNNYSPSWYTLNLKVSYPILDILQLNAGIENITDQRYRPYSSGISGAGRNFIFSLRASF
ncbi:TonB-dependent receptor [Algoriphagus limi]|uniref:TonB-dependent receptor n=1 Tax=Algoriphagus limi TaxID=2975273 RepID=A0ABT2G482_9BACT|nr:TonB-dependent receptor [Algoriphagus limi]MCS5490074.1 TonB-dependent receptor [Algoriphagus limi]